MAEPCRVSFRDGRLASIKAEEAACRRFQAAGFLESMVGPLGLSPQPSEQEFISCLRNGLVLCNTINKIQPGAVPKVVANQSVGLSWDAQPLPAYQYFENIRNFLVAVNELKLPTFEASDLEKDSLEAGSATKVVDCLLALKAYHECKLSNGRNGSWKNVKSPAVACSAGRIQSQATCADSSVHCIRLELPDASEMQPPEENENTSREDATDSVVRVLTDGMLNAKENIDLNILDSWHQGKMDYSKHFSKIISSCMKEQQLCTLCLGKEDCNHWKLLKAHENELSELKALLSSARLEFLVLQSQLQNDLKFLGIQIQGLSAAALGYHQAMKENQDLYNMIQELKGNIRVFCRIRPSFNANMKETIDYVGNDGSLVIVDPLKPQNTRRTFQFNKVFGVNATQDEVYKETQPLIRSVMDGYNVCIFAYGQTGSGKTHTMCGPSNRSDKAMGINYMALSDLFQISFSREDMKYEIRVQMVEIYNEQVRDLLVEDASATKLEIRTCSSNGGLSLPGASMHLVQSSIDVLNLMALGENNRAFHSTAINHRSSRSHSILTVHVHGTDVSGSVIRSCLHLVDLAGSERVDKSEVTGDRLREAQHINKSLSCLGDVIAALAQKNAHIPYRNSKLTQLLQNSLGGHAKMLMFAHVSPEASAYGETISTLKFAQRVSSVELGTAHVNKESSEIRELKEEIDVLKKAIWACKAPEKTLHSHKMKENTPINLNIDQPASTPPRTRRLSIENAGTLKSGASNLDEGNVLKCTFSRPNQTERTPPRPRRLSIENAGVLKKSTASILDENKVKSPIAKTTQTQRTPPRPRRLSIENGNVVKTGIATKPDDRKLLKSPLSSRKFTTKHGPSRARRLSLEGSRCERKQQETKITGLNIHKNILDEFSLKENIIHPQVALEDVQGLKVSWNCDAFSSPVPKEDFCLFSTSTCNLSCPNQPVMTETRSTIDINQPETPCTSGKSDAVTPYQKALARKSQLNVSGKNKSSKGSQFRKSLQTIGKLINGSERRNNQRASDTPSSKFVGSINHDMTLTDGGARVRRQSLTTVESLGLNVSRRASLGGKSTE